MNNKTLKLNENREFFGVSNEYIESLGLSIVKENDSNANQRKLQKRYDSELKNLIARNKKLLAIIAHDIRSPISLIIGYLSLIKENINNLNKKEIEENIESALFTAKKSVTLLENLLKWALTENAIKTFQQEYINVLSLIQEEIDEIEMFATQKQIKIYLKNIPHKKAYVDKNMIKTVFRNLLSNAIKYSFKNGEIVISGKDNAESIEISIQDNGIGINKYLQSEIFTPKNLEFALGSVDESKSGFGLLLCKEIIDMHKGQLWMTSEKGMGSEFKFTLPIRP